MDIQEQLAILRAKVAAIQSREPAHPPLPPPQHETVLTGEVRSTPYGRHFETEKLYPREERHGFLELAELLLLPDDLLHAVSEGAVPACPSNRWAFLDTETTGLAGGSGTCAFLIGIGATDPEGFRVRQFFMRDYCEEASQLHAVASYLERFDVLITYNGRSYDQPLLETRYRMCRAQHPFDRLPHLDLLYGARRLWKRRMENCKLTYLEREVLGVEREGDVPGSLIPYLYFEYLRTQRAARLVPVFHHNVLDIVTLACLTAVVPEAYRNPETVPVRHGADLLGVARWLIQVERPDQALLLFERAVHLGLPDRFLFPTLLESALLRKKLGHWEAAIEGFTELTHSHNPCRIRAWEELAKYYEHRERNWAMALDMTTSALECEDTPELRARETRLRARLGRRPAKLSVSAAASF